MTQIIISRACFPSILLFVVHAALITPLMGQTRKQPENRSAKLSGQQNTQPRSPRPNSTRQNNHNVKPRNSSAQRQTFSNSPSTRNPRVAQVPRRRQQLPPGFPLSAERQKRIDKILEVWEQNTSTIKTFQCQFRRDEHDPRKAAFDPKTQKRDDNPANIALGEIRFAAPDRGSMVDKNYYSYNRPPRKKGMKAYSLLPNVNQNWICDGDSIYVSDPVQKLITERQLPEDLKGKAISEGPLPFIFGAKAETMKRRYWIREVTPKDNPKRQYFLEVTPKRTEDQQNYKKIIVTLDTIKKHVLPVKMLVVHHDVKVMRSVDGAPKNSRPVVIGTRHDLYSFEKHRVNDHRVHDFLGFFLKPKVPKGWQKVVRDSNNQIVHQKDMNAKRTSPLRQALNPRTNQK